MTPHPHPDVLVVDDSRMMRALVTRGLCSAGVPDSAIIHAENGARALEHVRARAPGLVITDVHMPEMSGTELLERLSAEGLLARIPVVVVTSLSNSRRILEFIRLGAAAVIRKPISSEGLARELRPFVERLRTPPALDEIALFGPPPEPETAPELEPEMVDLDAVLELAALGTLRASRFVDVARVPTGHTRQRVLLGASITLHAPVTGQITCWADLGAAGALAQSLSGDAPEDDDTARFDAVGELCNQLVGGFFAQVAQLEGDPLFESDFGLPTRFVVPPGQALPPYHQVFSLGAAGQVICHIDIAAAEPVGAEAHP